MSETERCPTCDGAGVLGALVRYETGCKSETIRCFVCGGMGFIDRDHAEAIRDGKRRSKERIEAGLSIREAAALLGVAPTVLSDLEHAKAWRPTYTLAQVNAARRAAGRPELGVSDD